MKKRILAMLLSALLVVNISACSCVSEIKDNPTLENTEQIYTEKNC